MRNSAKIRDLKGQKFGKLTPIRIVGHKPVRWECKCDCGNLHIASASNITTGQVNSCGCTHKIGNPTHSQCYTRVYRIYAKLKRRCYVEDDIAYPRYGGRGIVMCDEWKNSFEAFSKWAYENGYDDSLSLDRIDNNGIYSPENCRWANNYQQANNKRNNKIYTYKGKTQTLPIWCRELNLPYSTIWYRLSIGWTFEDAVSVPVNYRRIKNA